MMWNSPEACENDLDVVKGLFWLGSEGPIFTPTGPDGAPVWSGLRVNISEEMTIELARKLGVPAADLQFLVNYEVEFRGNLHLHPVGSGGLDEPGGSITVVEVLSAQLPAPANWPPRYGSIRNLLLGIRKRLIRLS
jgi:hypothetical protein